LPDHAQARRLVPAEKREIRVKHAMSCSTHSKQPRI